MGVKPEIRKESIPEYLQYGYVNSPNSPYEYISQVPPGNLMIYSSRNSELKLKQYWSPTLVEMSTKEENSAESELRDLLSDSIITQLNSDRPVGTLLSGGIDSSLVTAIAARHSTERLSSFSLGFEDSLFDESRYAMKVANYLNTNHSQLIIGSNNTELLMQVICHLDIPFADSSLLPTYAVSQLARERVVVVLGGDGGDEVFGGYQRYKLNIALSRLNYLLKILPSNAFRKLEHSESRVAKALSLFGYSKSDLRYQRMMSLVSESELESLVIGEIRSILESESVKKFSFSKSDLLRQMQLSDINSYLPGDLLFKTDIASMAHGLEMRSPLLDHRIVNLGLNLQNKHKIGFKNSKPILRKLLFELIPKNLVDRPKKGFGVPLASWLRSDFETIVNENLLIDRPRISDWVNMEYLSFCINQHKKGKNYSGVIWPLLVMELVIRKWEQ
jgi:asparagine synthase (glutamine-hydrolysing)